MFLRGAGSQNYSQVNGGYYTYRDGSLIQTNGNETSVTYASGSIGEIQGDGTREFMVGSNTSYAIIDPSMQRPEIHFDALGLPLSPNTLGWFSYYAFPSLGLQREFRIPLKPKHYKYRLSGHGGENANYWLEERVEDWSGDEADFALGAVQASMNAMSLVAPVANEIRPVNMAVKYYIRAK